MAEIECRLQTVRYTQRTKQFWEIETLRKNTDPLGVFNVTDTTMVVTGTTKRVCLIIQNGAFPGHVAHLSGSKLL